MPSKPIVVVLGMHRSGTSALTRGLDALGLSLGNHLIPGRFDNQKGFWEDAQVNEFNESLLLSLGYLWHSNTSNLSLDWEGPQLCQRKDDAVKLLSQKLPAEGIFAFKDPRTVVLLEFWQAVFAELELEPRYIFSHRNPLDTARSLAARDELPLDKSLYLWAISLLLFLQNTTEYRRVVVCYENLLEDPARELQRIVLGLDIPFELKPEALKEFADKFLDGGLKHHASGPEETIEAMSSLNGLQALYELATGLGTDQLSFGSEEYEQRLNTLQTRFERQQPLLKLHALAEQHVVALEQERDDLNQNVAELTDRSTALKSDFDASSAQLQSAYADLGQSNQALEKANEALTDVHSALEERTAEARKLNLELDRLGSEIDARDTHIEALNSEQAATREELTSTYQTLATRDRALETRSAEFTAAQSQQRVLEHQVHTLQIHADELQRSFSWRITAPLRWLVKNLVLRPVSILRAVAASIITIIWSLVPGGSNGGKRALKRALFTLFRFPLKYTGFYRDWVEYEEALRRADIDELPEGDQTAFSIEAAARRYEEAAYSQAPESPAAKLIAFYLPQFHQIPENNDWWGEGFTEWSNVKPALPQYDGHYQPHVPAELGYYDLTDNTVMQRQAEMAKQFGLGGFCFYFYWFKGKRLLESPVLDYLANQAIDFPFCLCWANENWSRTWDGLDKELLIAQDHSEEDDLALIEYLSKYFLDNRYIRIDGKPLLMVYHPSLLPDPIATAGRWREWCRNNGIGEIYLVTTHSFDAVDPATFGFDAATEFPPNNTAPAVITEHTPGLASDFEGIIYDWNSIAERSNNYVDPGYKLFPAVNPAWDNTARRKNRGAVFAGSTPRRYERWVGNAVNETRRRFAEPSEQLVFVNAWNEWAEGAHLEPDATYGFSYLNATRRALDAAPRNEGEGRPRLLVVGHDAAPHGAQYLALNMVKYLTRDFAFDVEVVLLEGGTLIEDYRHLTTVHCLEGADPAGSRARDLAIELKNRGFSSAISNTCVCGLFTQTLKESGFQVISLIHELAGVLESRGLAPEAKAIAGFADHVIVPSEVVAQGFRQFTDLPDSKLVLRPQGLYKRNRFRTPEQRAAARQELRQRYNLSQDQKIVLCAGYADKRKGIDLFVKAGLQVLKERQDVTFLWLGHWDTTLRAGIDKTIQASGLGENFLFVDLTQDTDPYFAGSDIYALTSREDPFPSVVMESLDVGVPVVGFDKAGGFTDLLNRGCGLLAPLLDNNSYADSILELLNNEDHRITLGECGERIVRAEFSFRHYLFDLLDMVGHKLKRVSVVLPNYNYENFLPARIDSILRQTYPIYELIVLDDASTDGSIEVIQEQLSEAHVDYRLILNEENSGSPFAQWMRGADLAQGEFLWIAEADDSAEPDFLETALKAMSNERVVLSYTESKQIDENDLQLATNYRYYTDDISREKWKTDYVETGKNEISQALAVKNTIPNVSAVVFKAAAFKQALHENYEEIISYRNAGDWVLYIRMLQGGDIAFFKEALNIHRRHSESVTISSFNRTQYDEIAKVQSFASDCYPPDENISDIAENYLCRLREQFSLSDTSW